MAVFDRAMVVRRSMLHGSFAKHKKSLEYLLSCNHDMLCILFRNKKRTIDSIKNITLTELLSYNMHQSDAIKVLQARDEYYAFTEI